MNHVERHNARVKRREIRRLKQSKVRTRKRARDAEADRDRAIAALRKLKRIAQESRHGPPSTRGGFPMVDANRVEAVVNKALTEVEA